MSTSQAVARHPVRVVAARTGLSPHVLRAWERRHRVVEPGRSEGGQRLYSDLDIARLRLLHRLTEQGHGIGRLARLPLQELERLAAQAPAATASDRSSADAAVLRRAVLEAVRRLDAGELYAGLERAVVNMGVPAFLDTVAAPTLHDIGRQWREGSLGVAHEHLATAVFRRVLGWILGLYEVNAAAPRLVAATPAGERHELGAMLAAAAAAADGWGVTYLGADLPSEEIAAAARQVGAQAVALSIVYAGDDAALAGELERVCRGLPRDCALLLGGAGAGAARFRNLSGAAGVEPVDSLAELRRVLQRHRTSAAPAAP